MSYSYGTEAVFENETSIMNKDIATPKERARDYGTSRPTVKKSQLLIETEYLTRIRGAGVDKTTNVIEIRPGIGALTERV